MCDWNRGCVDDWIHSLQDLDLLLIKPHTSMYFEFGFVSVRRCAGLC